MTFASFEGHKLLANVPFLKHIEKKKKDISFGFPGPLRTAFGLKNWSADSKNQPDATALTENAIDWPNGPKISKYFFEKVEQFQKIKNGKSGGVKLFYMLLIVMYVCASLTRAAGTPGIAVDTYTYQQICHVCATSAASLSESVTWALGYVKSQTSTLPGGLKRGS